MSVKTREVNVHKQDVYELQEKVSVLERESIEAMEKIEREREEMKSNLQIAEQR